MFNYIKQGTTPTLYFTFDEDPSYFELMHIAFEQNGELLFIKEKDDCVIDGNVVTTTLTQEETMMFKTGARAYSQIAVKYPDGNVDRSDLIHFDVKLAIEGVV